jgi:hypothetical protein
MPIDLTTLSEAELVDLNRRIVERLRLMQSARQLTALASFTVGMLVEFTTDAGLTVRGNIARLNRRTATIVAQTGSWRVSPSLLRPVAAATTAEADVRRVLPMPADRRPRG